MKLFKSKFEKIVIVILILAGLILFLMQKRKNYLLEKKGVFVIGKLHSSSSEGEISWVYKYEYFFNGQTYYKQFTGPLDTKIRNDSLLFFNILPDDPEVCKQLTSTRVPKCLTIRDVPKTGWLSLPLKICD